MKSEGNPKKLAESQDNVWVKLSQVLSQSSCSTNFDDFEKAVEVDPDTGCCTKATRLMEMDSVPEQDSCFQLRNRQIRKVNSQDLDSWEREKKRRRVDNESEDRRRGLRESGEDSDMDTDSEPSVSMLQGCCQEEEASALPDFPELTETCADSKLEMIMASSYVDSEEDDEPPRTETGTQTDFSPILSCEADKDAVKHARFIGGVIALRFALTSKKTVATAKVSDILKCLSGTRGSAGVTKEAKTVPSETIGYVLRSAEIDQVFQKTVEALTSYLEEAVEKDLAGIAWHWKNSVYETAVEMLNEAVDAEPGVRRGVDLFLGRVVGSILTNDARLKNLELESKSMFVVHFCRSAYLTYTTINHVVGRLKSVKSNKQPGECSTLKEKLARGRLNKNCYFLLRILECLLGYFKSKLQSEEAGIDEALVKKPEAKNYNVLETWKKRWREAEVGADSESRKEQEWKLIVGRWCDDLDDVLVHFVKWLPVTSMAAARCAKLAKEVVKEVSGAGIGSTSIDNNRSTFQ